MTLAKFISSPRIRQYVFDIRGDASFSVVEFTLQDGINEIGHLDLKLACPNRSVDPTDMLGTTAHFSFRVGEDNKGLRHYHGIVQRFELVATDRAVAYYRARITPRFWRLGLKRQSRVHVTDPSEGKSLEEVATRVLREGGLSGEAVEFLIQPTKPYSFLAQYRESDLDFVRRLCEEEGISFFINHDDRQDILVFVDINEVLEMTAPFSEVLFREADTALTDEMETVHSLELSYQMRHRPIEFRDYNFHNSRKQVIGKSHPNESKELEYYDFPGKFMEPENPSDRMTKLADLRHEEFASASVIGVGTSDFRSLAAGRLFRLRCDAQPLLDRRWVCLGVTHHGTQLDHADAEGGPIGLGGVTYTNTFRCLPNDVTVRPIRTTPKPIVAGSQTAVVVGPDDEEIYTDEYGRVKIQLHWDRERSYDETSSFWVRVNQHWAGRHWGMFFLPRVGQEVIIDFLEGDPDRPIVTGAVYNDYQRTPYLLPEHKTRSTIKTDSTPGGEGFNEIRFEDKKGKEQIFIHAERNVDVQVKHDMMERIGSDRHVVVGWEKDGQRGGNLNEKVFGDHHRIVKGDCHDQIEGDQILVYGDGDDPNGGNLEVIVDKSKKECIAEDSHLTVDGEQRISTGKNFFHTVDGEYHLKSAKPLHITSPEIYLSGEYIGICADTKISLVIAKSWDDTPDSVITIAKSGITINGKVVEINSPAGYSYITRTDANPIPAVEPLEPEKPNEPTIAADDRTGEKSLRSAGAPSTSKTGTSANATGAKDALSGKSVGSSSLPPVTSAAAQGQAGGAASPTGSPPSGSSSQSPVTGGAAEGQAGTAGAPSGSRPVGQTTSQQPITSAAAEGQAGAAGAPSGSQSSGSSSPSPITSSAAQGQAGAAGVSSGNGPESTPGVPPSTGGRNG